MTWVATAIIGSAVVGAGASAYGANQAAGAASRSGRLAREAEMAMYTQNRADLAPWRRAGRESLGQIERMFLGTPGQQRRAFANFQTSPGYQFQVNEGVEAMANSASARGGQLSGNAVAGESRLRQGLASQEYNQYVNHLFGIAGLGQSATNTGVQAGANTASNIANIYQNTGNARGSAYMQGAAGVNSAVQGGLQNWAFNTYMNPGGGGGTGGWNPSTGW